MGNWETFYVKCNLIKATKDRIYYKCSITET